ncbi:MAG TPA: RDD family protein [Pyrinomonadaceae bacterium]|nr:RDD family protein [Pyrinomonadaceae bacterium]
MDSSPNDSTRATEKRSTLIEFPGVARNSMPEWRKELSERVREVQEKRAREAAREAAEAERQRLEAAINPPQLELLPPAQMPAMNPLVAAALKRIERAHQQAPSENRQPRTTLATAVAYAPEREDNEMSDTVPSNPQLAFEPEVQVAEPVVTVEKAHHLAVVPVSEPVAPKVNPPKSPKRLIVDDDPALNYLDSISRTLCVDDLNRRSASALRRLVCALLDLIFCALLSSPIAGAMYLTGSNLRDPKVIAVLAGSVVVMTFLYLTLLTALTGRTWAMRLLSLRVIDTKTGLIPTGGQSIGRSFFYLMSLATVVGIFFALISREGYTVHDRFTRTAVVTT